MADIILVTGGARSGKSAFAEQLARRGHHIAYFATAEIYDEEMRYRVQLHRERRPSTWDTYEVPFAAHQSLRAAGRTHDLILFDCLTVYLSNLLCALPEETLADEAAVYQKADETVHHLLAAADETNATLVIVTNEVGSGIVPENRLARLFRDIAGRANQQIARVARSVYLVVSGIPIDVKKWQAK